MRMIKSCFGLRFSHAPVVPLPSLGTTPSRRTFYRNESDLPHCDRTSPPLYATPPILIPSQCDERSSSRYSLFARCTFKFECMTIGTLLEPGTRNVVTFRYCTTCKRFLEHVRFNFKRKTCSACLLKSRGRAHRRRRKLESENAKMCRRQVCETLAKLKAAGRRTCSSCKVAKTPPSFATKRKTCRNCLDRRRLRRTHHLTDRLQHSNVASQC